MRVLTVACACLALAPVSPLRAQAPAPAPVLSPAPATGSNAVFRCPGPPVLYTDAITPQEAKDRGCRTIDGAPITIMQAPKPRPRPVAGNGNGASAPRPPSPGASQGDLKVDPQAQRQRDSDARRILEAELRREEERLAALQRDYNGGNPERRGEEQNYARYQERVNEMKSGIARKESDIAAIKRELAKLPQ
ncbi:hypothetical protein BurJ1DRAFT_1440 [Burkholderiales bacterium JOSHI_001]|nr:hypothetical protein BurJ1DRAFT_1440 [Burkholderiales bacterium JOSHI_001]